MRPSDHRYFFISLATFIHLLPINLKMGFFYPNLTPLSRYLGYFNIAKEGAKIAGSIAVGAWLAHDIYEGTDTQLRLKDFFDKKPSIKESPVEFIKHPFDVVEFKNALLSEMYHALVEIKDQPLSTTLPVIGASLLFGLGTARSFPRFIPGFENKFFGNSSMEKFKLLAKIRPFHLFLHSVVLAPLIEETAFRIVPGVALTGDIKGDIKWEDGLLTSLFFGLLHVIPSPPPGMKRALPIGTSFAGFVFWYMMREYGAGNAMLSHSAWNLVHFIYNVRR